MTYDTIKPFHVESLLHGGDYNPDQWLDQPEILERDIQMLKDAHCNEVTLGVFAWSAIEPREGVYELDWMEEIIDRLYANGIYTILATPSGARPKWMADKYPQVLRVDAFRRRALFGARHNHCLTSPVFREKVAQVDWQLSRRFGRHPGVILWHLSNELNGECHCPLCQEAFRTWLRERYTTIEELNRRWYTSFWSHTYQSFEQVESPSPLGEESLHGLNLDWNRFVTEQTASFLALEREAVRKFSDLPVTTNLMYYFPQVNYFRLARELDVASWDTYPTWHKTALPATALDNGLWHDLVRSLLGRPYLQMESAPTSTNWQGVSKLKKPGMLLAQSLQAIAHGADAALYFQIRQSRGSSEKFHGAVIDHYGGEDTRSFREVAKVGKVLSSLKEVAGAMSESSIAILYDWESNWAMENAQGPRNQGLHYKDLLLKIYRGCRKNGYQVDFVDEEGDLTRYRLLILPMVYQFREGFAERLAAFTEGGGHLIVTYHSGVADETDLCYLGGAPHGLLKVLGLRSGEIDGLYDWEENHLVSQWKKGEEGQGGKAHYSCKYLCDLPVLTTATPLLYYGDDFYEGTPALTRNVYGKGLAWYVATHANEDFFVDLIAQATRLADLSPLVEAPLPEGLFVSERQKAGARYLFYQNFGVAPQLCPLPSGRKLSLYGEMGKPLPPGGTLVIRGEERQSSGKAGRP